MTDAQTAMPAIKTPSRTRRILVAAVKLIVLVVVLYYVGRALVHQLENVRLSDIHFNLWFMLLAVLSVTAGRIIVGFAYRFLLHRMGSSISAPSIMAILWLPQLGTYVPGKVATLLGVVWMMGRHRVPPARATKITFVVTFLSIILGIVISVPLTLWDPIYKQLPQAWVWCVITAAACLVTLHPKVLNLLLHVPMKKMGFPVDHTPVRIIDYGFPALLLVLNWFFTGAGVWLAARSVTSTQLSWLPIIVSATALAVTVSFIVLIAPSGLGVREGVFLVVLTPLFGNFAAVVTVAARVLYLIVDLMLAGIGFLIMHLIKIPDQEEPRPEPELPIGVAGEKKRFQQ